jgi:hypothetical protein
VVNYAEIDTIIQRSRDATSTTIKSVSLSNNSDKPKSSEIRDKVKCESNEARLNTELGNCQADLNKVQLSLSQNDAGQDVNNGSLDNMKV